MATLLEHLVHLLAQNFNPRHYTVATTQSRQKTLVRLFQSTPLHSGDGAQDPDRRGDIEFQSTPLHSGDHLGLDPEEVKDHFNPRHYTVATILKSCSHHGLAISIHATTQWRQGSRYDSNMTTTISIHATTQWRLHLRQ